jgi:hypothetical protein
VVYHKTFPEFTLSDDIKEELLSLKFDLVDNSLNVLGYYDVTAEKIADLVATNKSKIPDKDFYYEFYGNDLANIGVMRAFDVPTPLADEILYQLKDIVSLSDERPYVRMQYMFDGQCVPIHYDATRSTSLMHPLMRHENTFTNFFEYLDDIEFVNNFCKDIEGCPQIEKLEDILLLPNNFKNKFLENDYISKLIYGSINRERKNTIPNPLNSKMASSVEIKDYPVLLNTDKLHDVRWTAGSLSAGKPRVSMFLKWNTLKFDQVMNRLL